MLRASFYITLCTAKNHLLVRLRRLREPRYLIFAIAGAAYIYFGVFMRIGAGRRTRRGGAEAPDVFAGSFRALAPVAGGIALLAVSAVAWVLPTRSTLFDFSDPEIHLLFPAPVTRRALLIHRLVRSQFKTLFGAVVLAFATNPSLTGPSGTGSNAARLLRVVAFWMVFVTFRIYFAGVTLVRARLTSAGARARWTAWPPVVAIIAAVAIVGVPVGRSLMNPPLQFLGDVMPRISEATASGLPHLVLWPFATLVQAVFADRLEARLVGIAGVLVVLIATLAWVLHTDGVFHGTTDDRWRDDPSIAGGPVVAAAARPINWPLRSSGSTEGLFFWKNGMEALRSTKAIALLPFLVPLLATGVGAATAGMSLTGAGGLAAGLSFAALAIAVLVTVVGPQGSRSDLRGDLRHLQQLKTWPVKGAAVIRGELSWPVASLTLAVWLALACGTVFSAPAFPGVPFSTRLSLCAAASLLAPALIGAQLMVHNAAAVLLPGWMPTGKQRSRGLDSLGQRLILFAVVMVALMVIIAPGVIAGGFVAFVAYPWIGDAAAVPAAAVCLAVVAVEVLLVTEALGDAYDRIDVSSVEPAE